jgi:serine protease Do
VPARFAEEEVMTMSRFWAVTATLAAITAGAVWWLAPAAYGQIVVSRQPGERAAVRAIEVLSGRGSSIGVTVRDVDESDVNSSKLADRRGVIIEHVDPESPAEKGGMKSGDVVVGFDGDVVRSARQFARLVEETPSGRKVKATVMREGSRVELEVTPSEGSIMRRGSRAQSSDAWAGRLQMPDLPSMPDLSALDRLPDLRAEIESSRGQSTLGVGVQTMTSQLAQYFGAKEGLLVSSVRDDSRAAKAGLRAGDVITEINGHRVGTPSELRRQVREAAAGELTIGIVRDKKAMSLEAPPATDDRPSTRRRWPV